MPSPFPGMDPYLEHPDLWPGVHLLLIAALAQSLAPQLRPKYLVSVEVRMYETSGERALLVGIPDVTVQRRVAANNPSLTNVAVLSTTVQPVTVTLPVPDRVREGYLQIQEVETKELITTIEILSPTNKRGKGRQIYEEKRERVLGSRTHLVEIDLLRAGEPMPVFNNEIESHYRILVARGERRPYADLYAFNLGDAIPSFPVPLRSEDAEPTVNLQQLLNEIYDQYGYDLKIDYSGGTGSPLSEAEAAWADALLRELGLR